MSDIEYKTRYYVEHQLLPKLLYTDRERLLEGILKQPEGKMNLYSEAEQIDPVNIRLYDRNLFSITYKTVSDKKCPALIVRISSVTTPKVPTLCKAVYLCFGKGKNEDRYFTSELSTEGRYLLCAWTEARKHLVFGETTEDEYATVSELYREMNLIENREQH